MSKELSDSVILLRNALGTLDLSQMQSIIDSEKNMSDEDVQNRANDTELFARTHFRNVLAGMILDQTKLICIGKITESGVKISVENEGQLLFGRGFLMGLVTVMDWFDKQTDIALGRFDKGEEEPEPGQTIPPVGELKT